MIVLALGGLASTLGATTTTNSSYNDYIQYADPFFGSENGGNVFPGVVPAPFSTVKLGIDVSSGTTDAYSGYLPGGRVTGFSMMHESGTGGAPKYGVVSQLPVVGNISNPLVDLSVSRSAPDTAQVGYYAAELANGIGVQLAASSHAGWYQYRFPDGGGSVVVDVSHVLPSYRGLGWEQHYAGGSLEVFDDGHYEGNGTYNGGWNLSPDWTIYFCGRFDSPPSSSKTFSGNGTRLWEYGARGAVSGSQRVGGVFSFNDTTHVVSRVGISFISSARACEHIDAEMPAGTTLSGLVQAAQEAWTTQVFSKVTTAETNATLLTQLYSSLYGMHLLPSNRTGEMPGWDEEEPYYDDWFTLWDLFRCTTPLLHVLQPDAYEEMIRSFVGIWRHDGFLPDARSSNYNGRVQGGSNADNVLADAYVKGVRGAVDWFDGIGMLGKRSYATVPAPSYDPMTAPDISSTKEGRGALPDWLEYGYITPAFSRAVSRAVEYSVNDFAVYQVLAGMNDSHLASPSVYLNRSRQWRNHWNPRAHSSALNESGFMVPRAANGSFLPQDPDTCGGCYWPDAYYEDNAWTYSFNAHHDAAHLVSLSGGPAAFAARLDKFFDGGIYNVANEPGFTTPYLYHFAGASHRSVARIRAIAQRSFGVGPAALPGNSDAGAMQSWLLWNMLGLYPLTGQTTFLLGSPWFGSVSVALGGGRFLNVSTNVAHDEQVQARKWFVQSVELDGAPWSKNWVTWEDVFEHGAELAFVLDATPNAAWESGAPPPPSPAS
ncbi:alpha-1,2-mannosidase family protein [Phyllosticta capitalensis]